jgi:putative glutathione S-transferase
MIGGKRVQGYPMNNNESFLLPNTQDSIVYLHQLYSLSDHEYTGRATVPVLWDSVTRKIICNESLTLLRAFNHLDYSDDTPDLYPVGLQLEIDRWNEDIYEKLSNAVYRVGFSISKEEKSRSIIEIDTFITTLEQHFSKYRYLVGEQLTEADLCLFSTLVRFDTCYYALFKCASAPLPASKNVMSYARRIYQMPSIAQSINFDVMYNASKENDIRFGQHILPKPNINWDTPIHI